MSKFQCLEYHMADIWTHSLLTSGHTVPDIWTYSLLTSGPTEDLDPLSHDIWTHSLTA